MVSPRRWHAEPTGRLLTPNPTSLDHVTWQADVELRFAQAALPSQVSAALRSDLIECWVAVSNAGGAVGFPFLPVTPADVEPVADALIGSLHPEGTRLLVAHDTEGVAGWVSLVRNTGRLVAHWADVQRLQTALRCRGRGVGSALMEQLRDIARDEMGLEQLRIAVRGGMGLEGFYERIGWREIGRHPAALRLSPGDDRDDVLMLLDPLDRPC